ncbi:alpha/beta fold hydrolase [Rhodobacterales bacterium HKCCE3408]|nr:alpha/beta fold hydrolase [Rhodobacterales bacterium HKCCE3408]
MDIDLPNGRIHAELVGEGTPILILHGGGLDHRHMMEALEPVFERTEGWRRVYVDLPGHGRSVADDSVRTQDDVLDMLSAFVSRAFPEERCALIGESRGSYHAMGLAHKRPDDVIGMMLIVAGGMDPGSGNSLPEHRTLIPDASVRPADVSAEAMARFERLVVQSPEILEKIERTKVPAARLADSDLAGRIAQAFTFSFDLSSRPDKVFDRPCLILNGRQDAIAGYRDMMDALELYPRATLAVLDRAGHSLAWEQPDLFEALTLEWLRRVSEFAG